MKLSQTVLKRSPLKTSCTELNPSGLSSQHYARIQKLRGVRPKKAPKSATGRRETSLPHIEYPVADGNYDTSRKPIKNVVLHTTVGSFESAASAFNNPSRQASSTYIIKLDGTIVLMLEEYYTPYTNGNYASNQQSITIEHVDNGDYNGPRTPELYKASAQLVADICKYYNLPVNRDTVKKHSEVTLTGTACPDSLDVDRIVREAAAIVNGTPASSENVKKYVKLDQVKKYTVNKDTNLWNFDKSGFKFDSVKPLKKGEAFEAYGYAEHSNGGKYYMTQYSFGTADTTGKPKATNGVNIADLTEVAAPAPQPQPQPIDYKKLYDDSQKANTELQDKFKILEDNYNELEENYSKLDEDFTTFKASSSNAQKLVDQIKAVAFGKGFWWTKLNKIKELVK